MSALRALRQIPTCALAARQVSVAARRTISIAAAVRAAPIAQGTSTGLRAFSVSARRFGEGTTDIALSQKLQEELTYEKESNEGQPQVPEFLKVFLDQGIWQLEDTRGHDEVILTRRFGNENLRLMFSVADIQNQEDEPDFAEGEEGEGEGADPDDPLHTYPLRVSLAITKEGGGALNLDMVCQEANFIIDNIAYYKDSDTGTSLTSDADWKRRGLYIGPQFDTLDVSVQEEFEKFLQERGVGESVALFIPEYAEYKEQLEYVQWLKNVKKFIDL